jgi:hypothetical protein
MRRTMVACVVTALVVGGGTATAQKLITSGDIKDGAIKSADIKNGGVASKDIKKGTIALDRLAKKVQQKINEQNTGPVGPAGPAGPAGAQGAAGAPGAQGPKGDPAETRVTALPGSGFSATNDTVSMTPDGVEFGPYADGGAEGGSLLYDGLNGQPLSAVRSLIYEARYRATDDTGGVGSPYLRVFLENDTHDAIFSPNTQSPDSDVAEGPFHKWVATSGLWRYDDDPGTGPSVPFADIVAAHGTEIISGIYVTTGFSAGTDLTALMLSFEVNGQEFDLGG